MSNSPRNLEDLRRTTLTASGGDHELSSAPRYLIRPIYWSGISCHYFTDQICIIDFGESYSIRNPPKLLGIPQAYCSPEVEFHKVPVVPSDIWALVCTLFEIRSGQELFQKMFGNEDEVIMQMVQLFGKLPEKWWSSWAKRGQWFDEEGKPSTYFDDGGNTVTSVMLESALAEGYHYIHFAEGNTGDDGERISFMIPEEEIRILANLLYQMLKYNPEERIIVAVAAEHEWFGNSST